MILEGKVVDSKTKEPLFGASVFISDSKGAVGDTPIGSPTNPDGEYFFEGGKVGDYISASYVGYKTKTKKINQDTSSVNFELNTSNNLLQEFEVVAEKPKPTNNKQQINKQKNNYLVLIGIGVIALLSGVVMYNTLTKK